ncbi:hypothetical protein V5H41_27855, partial [Salmonella enterica]
ERWDRRRGKTIHIAGWVGLVCGASAIYLAMGEGTDRHNHNRDRQDLLAPVFIAEHTKE